MQETTARADAAPSAPGAATPSPAAPTSEAAAGGSGVALRRGLPRVAGGEPWPPAGVAPSVTAAAASPSGDVPTGAAAQIGAAAGTGAAAEQATEAVADAGTATTAEPAEPSAPAAAPAPASPVAPAGPRAPLPFTPTVWPGAAARIRPTPKPQPERIRGLTKAQWAGAIIVGGAGLLFAAAMAVFAVRWFISLEFMQDFLTTYPGEYHLPETAPIGIPAWIGWQHFFNVFLMVLIIRSGWQVRTEKRPTAFWTPRNNPKRKISLALWFHQSLDILWLVNGAIFVALLFVTGQWMRLVPTSWDVFPNAISAALQYVSLDWPTENGWVNYNSLQQLAYFTTVFLAAPLAAITGVRMSGVWPKKATTLSRIYPVEWARAIHFPVMLYFVFFIIVHVALVFATGALRNLNHMYASQDVVNWAGFWIFFASMVVIIAGWIAARPLVLAPIAKLFGTVKGR